MPTRRPIVLCIDDAPELPLRKHLLELNGYDVVAVTNGRDGLSVLSDCAVDATVLDLDAPGMNGAMVRRMKQIKPHIPVLLLLSPSAKVPAGKFPLADALVLKNESPTRLLKVLDHLLNVRFPFFSRWFGNWKHRVSA